MFPILVCLAFFSSKEKTPDRELTFLASWSLFIVSSIISYCIVRKNKYILIIASTVFLLKIAVELNILDGVFEVIERSGRAFILLLASCFVFIKNNTILLKQIKIVIILSIILSLFQINGFIWAQSLGSAINFEPVSSTKVLFKNYDQIQGQTQLLQSRPDGFSHNNNLTSQFLLYFLAIALFKNTMQDKICKKTISFLFLASFAAALNGGKVIILGLIFTLLSCFILIRKKQKIYLITSMFIIFFGYIIYYLLFPGLFVQNFNKDLFVHNATDRVVNFGQAINSDKIVSFAEKIQDFGSYKFISYQAIEENKKINMLRNEAFSGLAALGKNFIYIIVLALVLFVFWSYFLNVKPDPIKVENYKLAVLFAAATFACLFGGPFFSTVFFCFFVAPIFAPLLTPFYKKGILKS